MNLVESAIWVIQSGPELLPGRRDALNGDETKVTIDTNRHTTKWFHRSGSVLRWGAWVDPTHVMTRFAWRGTGAIPDFHNCHYWTFVSEAMRNLIELFEPGVHQFLPVEIIGSGRRQLATQFLLIPGQGIRCFAVGISYGYDAIGPDDQPDDWIWFPQTTCRHPRPLFEGNAVGSKHLWIPVDFSGQLMVVSNDLRVAIQKSGLKNVDFTPLDTRENNRFALPVVKPSPFYKPSNRLSGADLLIPDIT